MEQNKMTAFPWAVDDETAKDELYIVSNGIPDTFFAIASLLCDPMDDETRANAKGIVTAVNATHGAGINPESVKDIRDTLQAILNIQLNGGDLSDLQHYDLLQEAKAAIEKSKL